MKETALIMVNKKNNLEFKKQKTNTDRIYKVYMKSVLFFGRKVEFH